MKDSIPVQSCSDCRKRDKHGNCTLPGLCVWAEAYADGTRRGKEDLMDPQIAERMGEKSYLSLIEKMDIARLREIFTKNPELSKIITMLIAKFTWDEIEDKLNVSRRTIAKASSLWKELRAEKG